MLSWTKRASYSPTYPVQRSGSHTAVLATCLLKVAKETDADLLTVGSYEHSRVAGILFGGVATEVLHEAQRSVLLARRPGGTFGTIVAGVDGSTQSLEPHWPSPAPRRRRRKRRFVRSPPRAASRSTSMGSSQVQGLRGTRATRSQRSSPPPRPADLLVVGSRGLHGLGSLGSVSERVAHRACCSVLVARDSAS